MNPSTQDSYIPQQAYLYFPKGSEYKTADNQRMIFDGNTKFDKKEIEGITHFRTYAKKHNYALKPIWTDNMILRFLYANGFKMDKTMASIKEHTAWRETCLPVKLDDELVKFLNSGLLYIHGRDHKFRPIVIFNVYKLDPKTVDIDLVMRAMTFWFEYVINEWMLPGQIENWVFIVNMKGMGIAALAVQSVRKLFQYLQDNFKCRLHSLYCLNTPATIYVPWQIVKKFLDEVTVKKIQFSKAQDLKGLFHSTNAEQVEQQYGGLAPNATQYWPPTIPSNNYLLSQDNHHVLVTKEEYKVMYQNGQLKNMKVDQSLIQDKPVIDIKKEVKEEHDLDKSNQMRKLPLESISVKENNKNLDYVSPDGSTQKSSNSVANSYEDIDVDYFDDMEEGPRSKVRVSLKEFGTKTKTSVMSSSFI